MFSHKAKVDPMTAEDASEFVRPELVSAIEALRKRGLSKMQAYAAVGKGIGKSSDWVRYLVGRQSRVSVALHDYFNLKRYVTRLEGLTRDNLLIAQQIRDELDALARTEGDGSLYSVGADPQSSGTREASRS